MVVNKDAILVGGSSLTHSFPKHPFSTLWKHFSNVLGGRESVHWKQMG